MANNILFENLAELIPSKLMDELYTKICSVDNRYYDEILRSKIDKYNIKNFNNTIEYKIFRNRTNPYYHIVFGIDNTIYKIFININTKYKIHQAFQSGINNGFFKNITEIDKFIYLNNVVIGYIMPKYTLFKDKYKKLFKKLYLKKKTERRLVHRDYIFQFPDKFFKRSENLDIKIHDEIINNNNDESFGSIKIYENGVWIVWSLPSNYLQLYKQLLDNTQSSGIVHTDFIFSNIGVNKDNKCYLYDLESLMYLRDCNSYILKKYYSTLPKYYAKYLLNK